MNTWKVILATLVIFIAGVVTGGLLVSYSDRVQQKHHRLWPREATNHRPDSKQPVATPREPGQRGQYGVGQSHGEHAHNFGGWHAHPSLVSLEAGEETGVKDDIGPARDVPQILAVQ